MTEIVTLWNGFILKSCYKLEAVIFFEWTNLPHFHVTPLPLKKHRKEQRPLCAHNQVQVQNVKRISKIGPTERPVGGPVVALDLTRFLLLLARNTGAGRGDSGVCQAKGPWGKWGVLISGQSRVNSKHETMVPAGMDSLHRGMFSIS